MASEIERKFLLKNESFRDMAEKVLVIRQGYLSREIERTVRVRTIDKKGYLTVKGKNSGFSRLEFEYEIPYSDAMEILGLCAGKILEKKRWIVNYHGKKWEIDEYGGELAPLIVAEIELTSEKEPFEIPPFIGTEVTGDPRYYNSML